MISKYRDFLCQIMICRTLFRSWRWRHGGHAQPLPRAAVSSKSRKHKFKRIFYVPLAEYRYSATEPKQGSQTDRRNRKHGENVRLSVQTAAHRRQRGGQDVSAVSIQWGRVQHHLHLHYRSVQLNSVTSVCTLQECLLCSPAGGEISCYRDSWRFTYMWLSVEVTGRGRGSDSPFTQLFMRFISV